MVKIKRQGAYILSIDAKDIFISNNYIEKSSIGYNPRRKDGSYNTKRFINSLDYSIDLIKLAEIYYKKYRTTDFTFFEFGKEYCPHVINVTFKYANKEFNQVKNSVYVRFGYDYFKMQFSDGVCLNENGELIGIEVGSNVLNPLSNDKLEPYFSAIYDEDAGSYSYSVVKQPKTMNSRADLRNTLYRNGFWCDGIHYVRMKRSSGSARVGKCLFVNEELYPAMKKWQFCGLDIKDGQEIDLAALEAYISLPTSSIIGTLTIEPKNILVIDDFTSTFKERVMATRSENGHLVTEQEDAVINNSIWDGESLLDKSLFGEYQSKGMILLRNLFFKSCCFNTNIQKWFSDNNIYSISQLNGWTVATDIKDIKMITTPSSIKFLKFGKLDDWIKSIDSEFGVVKYEKPTHYFDGRLVQTHYQLINTLQLSKEEMEDFLRPSLEFAEMLRTDPAAVKLYIKYPPDKKFENIPMFSKNDVIYNLLSVNDGICETRYYKDFLDDLMRAFYKNIKKGHVLVNGNYSTLLGNPIEMLMESIGSFDGTSTLQAGTIHSQRFPYGIDLLGSRSPHTSAGNVLIVKNVENEQIDKYINLTNEIVCINSIGENILQRLNGADFDSDTMLLTDNQILIKAAKKNYQKFLVPTNFVSARKTKRYYTPEQQCDLDIKTSINKIGEIINFAQVLTSMYWDKLYHGYGEEDVFDIYTDICTLSVLSNLEIDKAKKEFEVDSTAELSLLRRKYDDEMRDKNQKKIIPHFFSHIERQKGYYNSGRKSYSKHATSMDYLQTIINGFRIKKSSKFKPLPFSSILDESLFYAYRINVEQEKFICSRIEDFVEINKAIYASNESSEEKRNLSKIEKDKMIAEISSQKIGFSTMFDILSSIDEDENKKIRNLLMEILFTTCSESFESAITRSQKPVYRYELTDGRMDGEVDIYEAKYIKIAENEI